MAPCSLLHGSDTPPFEQAIEEEPWAWCPCCIMCGTVRGPWARIGRFRGCLLVDLGLSLYGAGRKLAL